MDELKTLEIGTSEKIEEDKPDIVSHIPSIIQADTLFTFVNSFEYLVPYIKNACLFPRYCEEDIGYLNIPNLNRIDIPMKCFCDINLHKMGVHLEWYGYYGLAFSKEWGMKNRIQPIHYINPESDLCKDFSYAFKEALQSKNDSGESSFLESLLKSYLLHDLMYFKPYEGMIVKRTAKSEPPQRKCFTDECEWRFIPDLSKTEFPQVIYDNGILNTGIMYHINKSLTKLPEIALKFDYSDLKYIIIHTNEDFIELLKVIKNLTTDEYIRDELISKIIIWDKAKGDF